MVWIPGGSPPWAPTVTIRRSGQRGACWSTGSGSTGSRSTNDDFASFVADTGHVTVAERVPDAADYQTIPDMLVAASMAFVTPGPQGYLAESLQLVVMDPGNRLAPPPRSG